MNRSPTPFTAESMASSVVAASPGAASTAGAQDDEASKLIGPSDSVLVEPHNQSILELLGATLNRWVLS